MNYADLVGKNVILPIVGRSIPIIADEYSDPEKGSGAVKITPAHDFNDFEVGRRHNLPMISILDVDARINDEVPNYLQGLSREEARQRIVKEMELLGLLERIEENPMTVPYGDRSGVVIEPMLTDQWFVDAETLARPSIKAVEEGQVCALSQNIGKTPTTNGCEISTMVCLATNLVGSSNSCLVRAGRRDFCRNDRRGG